MDSPGPKASANPYLHQISGVDLSLGSAQALTPVWYEIGKLEASKSDTSVFSKCHGSQMKPNPG